MLTWNTGCPSAYGFYQLILKKIYCSTLSDKGVGQIPHFNINFIWEEKFLTQIMNFPSMI